jgi:hypothetical protein
MFDLATAIVCTPVTILFVWLVVCVSGLFTKAWDKYHQHVQFIWNYKKETLRLWQSLAMPDSESDVFTDHFSSMHLHGVLDADDPPPPTKDLSESSSNMSKSQSTVEDEDEEEEEEESGEVDAALKALTLSQAAEKLDGSAREKFVIAHSTALTLEQKVELTFVLQREEARRAAVVKVISGTSAMMTSSFCFFVVVSIASVVFFFHSFVFSCLYSICFFIFIRI